MKRTERFLVLAFCSLALLSIVCLTNVLYAAEVTVTGTVYISDRDDNDNVTDAVITTNMGDDYIIVPNAAGKELFELNIKVVRASGVVGEDSDGNKTLTVTNYEVMPELE